MDRIVGGVKVTVPTRALGDVVVVVRINTTHPQCAFEAAGRGAQEMIEMMRRELA